MNFEKFSLNGEVRPIAEAVVPVANIGYAYGFGVYETIRVMGGVPYFAKQHAERLLSSAAIIGLAHPYSEQNIQDHVSTLAEELRAHPVIPAKAGIHQADTAYNLKIILIGGAAPLLYIFPTAPRFPDKSVHRDGVRTTLAHYERPFPSAKTLSMLQSYLAFTEAQRQGCYEALLVGEDGKIAEGTASNFFLIQGTMIYVPPKEKILEGVTMKIVLALAEKNGFTVETRAAAPSELADYDGAFLTSTSSKVVPIRAIGTYEFPAIPKSVRTLMKLYDDFLSSCNGVFTQV